MWAPWGIPTRRGKPNMRKRLAVPLATTIGLLALAACGDDKGSEGTAAATESSSTAAAPTASATAPSESATASATASAAAPGTCDGGGATIGFVLHVRLQITQLIADGAQVAADECNVKLDVVGPTAVDAQAAIAAFQSEIA